MITIPHLNYMSGQGVVEFANEIRKKLETAEAAYALADSEKVEAAEAEYMRVQEVAMAISNVIKYMNEEHEKRIATIVKKKEETLKKKTIRQLWNDTPRPFAIKDPEYRNLVDFFSLSVNWNLIFRDWIAVPSSDFDIYSHFNLWDCTVEDAKKKLEKVIEKNKKL